MAFAILVQGIAARGHLDDVKQALATLAQESMQQPGTICYDFYQDQENPFKLFLFAMWEDEAGWQANVKSPEHDRYMDSLTEESWEARPDLTKLQPMVV